MSGDLLEKKREANRVKAKRWRERHPEKAKEARDKCRAKNKEKYAPKKKEWEENNKERRKEYEAKRIGTRSEYHRKHNEQRKEYQKEYNKLWREANPDKLATQLRVRRARRLGAEGSHTTEETDYLLIRQYYMCWNAYCMCDLRTNPKALDHKVSLAKGGSNGLENLQWLCVPCNTRKGTLSVDDWLKREEKRAA